MAMRKILTRGAATRVTEGWRVISGVYNCSIAALKLKKNKLIMLLCQQAVFFVSRRKICLPGGYSREFKGATGFFDS